MSRAAKSLTLIVLGLLLILAGPDWPTRTTGLFCEDSDFKLPSQMLPNMSACSSAMAQANAAGMHCFCSVQRSPLTTVYYLGFVPLVFLFAVWVWSRAAARGMAAVVVVLGGLLLLAPWAISSLYRAGFRIRPFFQTVAVFWPQFLFFGPALYSERSSSMVLPPEWSYVFTTVFWIAVGSGFGLLAARDHRRPFAVLLLMAAGTIFAIVYLIWLTTPFVGWKLLFQGP